MSVSVSTIRGKARRSPSVDAPPNILLLGCVYVPISGIWRKGIQGACVLTYKYIYHIYIYNIYLLAPREVLHRLHRPQRAPPHRLRMWVIKLKNLRPAFPLCDRGCLYPQDLHAPLRHGFIPGHTAFTVCVCLRGLEWCLRQSAWIFAL